MKKKKNLFIITPLYYISTQIGTNSVCLNLISCILYYSLTLTAKKRHPKLNYIGVDVFRPLDNSWHHPHCTQENVLQKCYLQCQINHTPYTRHCLPYHSPTVPDISERVICCDWHCMQRHCHKIRSGRCNKDIDLRVAVDIDIY